MAYKDEMLLVRALNATRHGYFPTYLGLHLIGDQLPSGQNRYLERTILRRLASRDLWRFKRFALYKGSTRDNEKLSHDYRDCLAPSSFTAVAEAFILARLSSDPAFKVSDRVYSYLWPKTPYSGGNYQFFAEGYKRRNLEIYEALSKTDTVAIVVDIKNFYPSVDKEQILSLLEERLAKAGQELQDIRDAIIGFYCQLMSASVKGIPIGPACGHLLGHLVLGGVDRELTEKFKTNYFRYVDDIVVVCSVLEKNAVQKIIENNLSGYGFSANLDKIAVLNREEWERYIIRDDVSSDDDFRAFTNDLTIYLAFHPQRANIIKDMFFQNGLAIPVSRLLARSSYSRFRRYFIRQLKLPLKIFHAASVWLSKDEDFLKRCLRLKHTYERVLLERLAEPVEQEPSLRRWQIQRIRRVLNTLFYLRDFNEWQENNWQFSKLPELIEQQALAEALGTGVVNPILPFYGRGASAFSEIWSEYRQSAASFFWPDKGLIEAEIESLTTLRLYNVIKADSMQISGNLPDSRLMKIVNQTTITQRSIPDLSFDDESESLRLGVSNLELSRLARTRYSLSEGTALEALTLTGAEYLS
ncbi:RNA-directed DNA polymerase [Methylomagnum sp.]